MADRKRASESESGEWFARRDGKITEEMDVFSAGCVLAEMWTDGRTVFNLSELYAYREGALSLNGLLGNIHDANVRVSHLAYILEWSSIGTMLLGNDCANAIKGTFRTTLIRSYSFKVPRKHLPRIFLHIFRRLY